MSKLRMTQRRTIMTAARDKVEQRIQSMVSTALARRFAQLKRELRRGNLRKRLHKADNPLKGPNNDWQPWVDEFTAALLSEMMAGVDDLFAAENSFWTSGGQPPAVWNTQQVVDKYQSRIGRQIKNIGQDTLANTQQTIADWYTTEQTLPELIDTLSQWYSPARAEMIATTEATGLAAQVGGAMMEHFGITRWRWDAFPDACPDCLELNGQTFDQADTDSYPPNHPNCRCGQYFLIDDDESLKFMQPEMVKENK